MADKNKNSEICFEGNAQQSAAYAKFRPTYSKPLYDAIYSYADASSGRDCALDIATGTGQAAGELAKRYQNVIAQDVSQTQLDQAASSCEDASRILFQQGGAESISLPDDSVDLVTIAQALHWVDQPKAFAEITRVLKPGGVFAAWGYDMPRIVDETDADALFRRLYGETLGPFWDQKRKLLDDHYKGIELPAPFIDELRWNTEMLVETTVGGLLGNISSWSAYQTYISKHHKAQDPVMRFHGELKKELEFVSHSTELDLSYPVFMILARKPTAAAPPAI